MLLNWNYVSNCFHLRYLAFHILDCMSILIEISFLMFVAHTCDATLFKQSQKGDKHFSVMNGINNEIKNHQDYTAVMSGYKLVKKLDIILQYYLVLF